MNDKLKGKYRNSMGVIGYKPPSRTGNSNGKVRDKLPANVPCKRANAGYKGKWHEHPNQGKRVLYWNMATGEKRFIWE